MFAPAIAALAAVTIIANLALLHSLRRLEREAEALGSAATRLTRVAVANDDVRAHYARVAPHYRAVKPRLRRALRR